MPRLPQRHSNFPSPVDTRAYIPATDRDHDYFSRGESRRHYDSDPDSDSDGPYYRNRGRGRGSGPLARTDSRRGSYNRPRPRLTPRDSSYYDPRDKYYLSGDEDKELGFRGLAPPRRNSSIAEDPRERESARGTPPRPRGGQRAHSAIGGPYRDESPDYARSPSPRRRSSYHRCPGRGAMSTRSRPRNHDHDDDHDRNSSRYYPPPARRPGTTRSGGSRASVQGGKRPTPSRRDTSAAAAASSSRSTSNADSRSRSNSSSTSRARSHSRLMDPAILGHAAQAGMEAAAATALKLRNDPSPWIGAKGTKVAAAAIGAAVVDTFVDRKLPHKKGGMGHTMLRQGATMALGKLVMKPAVKGTRMGRT